MSRRPGRAPQDAARVLNRVAVGLLVLGVALQVAGRPWLAIVGMIAFTVAVVLLAAAWVSRYRLVERR